VANRVKWGTLLNDLVRDLPGIIPPDPAPGNTHVYWHWAPLVDLDCMKVGLDELAKALGAEGLPVGAGYTRTPIYEYEVLKERRFFGQSAFPLHDPAAGRDVRYSTGLCPHAEAILQRMLVGNVNEKFTEEMVHDIARAIHKVFTYYAR